MPPDISQDDHIEGLPLGTRGGALIHHNFPLDGQYDFRAVATDGTGHTGTSPIRANVRIDNTAPSGSLSAPAAGATVGGTHVTLSASVSDTGSGVASVRYERSSLWNWIDGVIT